jgi:cytochrome P450
VNEELKDMPGGSLLVSDPPDHTRLRRPVSPAFTPRAIESLRPRVAAIVDAVLDGLTDAGPTFDVLADVGYPVALSVISELFDVGAEGAQLFADLTPALARGIEFDASADDLIASAVASTEMTLFLTPLLAQRRRDPGADFISALLALSDDHDPDGLSLGEVMSMSLLLLIAGHETTANLIANATLALLQHPDQISHLLADRGRAVEELLRCHGPVKLLMRTALVDQRVGGRLVRAGESVLVDVHAANHDPTRFPEPHRMDLNRAATGHLGFGTGIHFCLGAALARLEAGETLTRLFARHPDMTVAGEPIRWRKSMTLHALEGLVVTGAVSSGGSSCASPG